MKRWIPWLIILLWGCGLALLAMAFALLVR
jgi:hypothetical protein